MELGAPTCNFFTRPALYLSCLSQVRFLVHPFWLVSTPASRIPLFEKLVRKLTKTCPGQVGRSKSFGGRAKDIYQGRKGTHVFFHVLGFTSSIFLGLKTSIFHGFGLQREISYDLWLRFRARLPLDLLIKDMFDPFYHSKWLFKQHVRYFLKWIILYVKVVGVAVNFPRWST